MPDTFELELSEDIDKAVERAKGVAKKSGATFHGDRFAGMFRHSGVEGYYRVDGSTVVVTVSKRPSAIPLVLVENSIRGFFGVEPRSGDDAEDGASGRQEESRLLALRHRAKELVKKHALMASGAGLVPVPIADIAAVTAVQVKMLLELADLYDAEYSRSALREFSTALTGSTVARIGASALKAIPGIGSLIGGASMSIMSGASTYAVGSVATDELESGNEIGSEASVRVKRAYQEAFEEGKALVEKLVGQRGVSDAEVVDDSDSSTDEKSSDTSSDKDE